MFIHLSRSASRPKSGKHIFFFLLCILLLVSISLTAKAEPLTAKKYYDSGLALYKWRLDSGGVLTPSES